MSEKENEPDQSHAVQKHFSTDADTYDARHYGGGHRTFYGDRQSLVTKLLRDMVLPSGARVLDIACGPGHFLRDVAEMGFEPFGIDASPDMIRASAARMGAAARLVRGDGMALPFASNAFDAVNCSGLIEYIPRPAPLLDEILRVLKPGARVMLSSTNKLSPALALVPVVDAARRRGFRSRNAR